MLNSTCLTRKSVDNLLSLTHLQGNGLEWNLNLHEKLRKKRSMLSGTRTELLDTGFRKILELSISTDTTSPGWTNRETSSTTRAATAASTRTACCGIQKARS